MRSKNEREPGLVWPDSLGEALQSVATQATPAPCPTPSGPGCLYATSTTPVGLDISVPDVAGLGRSAALQDDIPGLIRTVSWTDRTGMEVELRVLIAEDSGPRRRWARQMLIDALRGSDTDDGVAPGVREPLMLSTLGSGGAAMAVPHGEPEQASAVSMA